VQGRLLSPVTDQASDLTPALQEANKANNKQQIKHQANYWGHSVKLLFIGSKGTPIILDTG
jgi:hypothetical protein